MMEILYFRGPSALYNPSAHGNGIYFATDTQEIIHNGLVYSGNIPEDVLAQVKANSEQLNILTNTEGEGSVQYQINEAINEAINEFATQLTDDGKVNTFKELLDYAAENGAELEALILELEEVKESNANLEKDIVLLKEKDEDLSELIAANTEAINKLSDDVNTRIETAFSWQDVN